MSRKSAATPGATELYMRRLADGLDALPAPDRAEVLAEIRSHIAEATAEAAGDQARALEAFGSPEEMATRILTERGVVKELLSIGPLVAGESTVYPVLKRLETDGMLVSHWVTSEAGPPRKYYSLSADGARFLADAQRAWESLVQSVSTLKEDNGE